MVISQGVVESGEVGHKIRGDLGVEPTALGSWMSCSYSSESVSGANDDSKVTELGREPPAIDQLVEELQEASSSWSDSMVFIESLSTALVSKSVSSRKAILSE